MRFSLICSLLALMAGPISAQEKIEETPPKATSRETRTLKGVFAIFETTIEGKPVGDIKAKLFLDKAPKTVTHMMELIEGKKSFTEFNSKIGKVGKLTRRPYFDGLYFHRVTPGLAIQGGCPLGTGRGNPGFLVEDEFSKDLIHNKRGILSMANEGRPNTNSSQFFFTLGPQPSMNEKFTIIGEIVSGDDVLDRMLEVPRNKINDRPLKPIMMKHVRIEREYFQ